MSAPRRSPRRSSRSSRGPSRSPGRPSATRPRASGGRAERPAAALARRWPPPPTGRSFAAELEALELEHLGALLAERVRDLLRGVVDPLLVEQHVRTEEALVEHPFDDLVARLLGFRLDLVGARVDLALLRDCFLRHVVAADPARLHRGDVHRNLARQVVGAAANLEQHADLVAGRMRIRGDLGAVDSLEPCRTRDDDVLAELAVELRALLLELRL